MKEKAKKAQEVSTCPLKKHVMTLCSVYIDFFSYIKRDQKHDIGYLYAQMSSIIFYI